MKIFYDRAGAYLYVHVVVMLAVRVVVAEYRYPHSWPCRIVDETLICPIPDFVRLLHRERPRPQVNRTPERMKVVSVSWRSPRFGYNHPDTEPPIDVFSYQLDDFFERAIEIRPRASHKLRLKINAAMLFIAQFRFLFDYSRYWGGKYLTTPPFLSFPLAPFPSLPLPLPYSI